MKIVLIDESLDRVGGVERVICTLANKLSEENKVQVISEFKTKDEPFYKYNDSVQMKYLINNTKIKTMNMKSKSLIYYIIRIFEKIKKKVLIKNRIKKVLKTIEDEDTIIFGRIFTALDFLPLMKEKNIRPKVIVRDAIHLEYYSNEVRKNIYRLFPEMVDTFIVSSDESIKNYDNFFGDKKINIKKIYNPLGIHPETCGNLDNHAIISIGRMDKQKGYESLIRAFSQVVAQKPDWKLKIYGDGNYYNEIKHLVNKLELQESVFLLHSEKNIKKVFNESSIFVLPSRYEGYANILVEAMACGMPVISYNWLMGVEEIIKDKENGIVVELNDRYKYCNGIDCKEDSKNLSEAILHLINDKELYEKIRKNATKIVESRNIDVIIKQWISLIN